jgi:hypothetical protein
MLGGGGGHGRDVRAPQGRVRRVHEASSRDQSSRGHPRTPRNQSQLPWPHRAPNSKQSPRKTQLPGPPPRETPLQLRTPLTKQTTPIIVQEEPPVISQATVALSRFLLGTAFHASPLCTRDLGAHWTGKQTETHWPLSAAGSALLRRRRLQQRRKHPGGPHCPLRSARRALRAGCCLLLPPQVAGQRGQSGGSASRSPALLVSPLASGGALHLPGCPPPPRSDTRRQAPDTERKLLVSPPETQALKGAGGWVSSAPRTAPPRRLHPLPHSTRQLGRHVRLSVCRSVPSGQPLGVGGEAGTRPLPTVDQRAPGPSTEGGPERYQVWPRGRAPQARTTGTGQGGDPAAALDSRPQGRGRSLGYCLSPGFFLAAPESSLTQQGQEPVSMERDMLPKSPTGTPHTSTSCVKEAHRRGEQEGA